jgi:phospholipid-transporting ATPase
MVPHLTLTHLVCSAWVIWTHVSIWGSIAIYFIFLLVYCIIWPNLGYTVAVNVFHVDYQMFSCAPFWYG